MKVTTSLLSLALAMAPLTAAAYQKADNMEQAKTMVTEDGYAIVTYAQGWDKYSKKTAERMMADPSVSKELGNAVVMTLAVPNITPKEEHEANKKRFGNLDLSFPNVYPAIILYNKDGHRLADICIPYSERNNPSAIAEKVRKAMSAAARQRKLLEKAAAAKGVEQARLLGEAALVAGVNKPRDIAKRIKQADPEDKTGMHQLATLNLPHKAIDTAKTKNWEETLAEIKGLMKNPHFTTEQQQQLCCICIGLLHRHGGQERQGELKEMIAKLRSLDPNSMLGQSADGAERLWVSELNLIQGWSPAVLPNDATPVEVQGDIPIKGAGTYEVTFTYQRGTEALRVAAVELYDGKKKIAEDRHAGFMGINTNNNVYTLTVPAAVKKPRLYVIFNMGQKLDSYGKITVSKK